MFRRSRREYINEILNRKPGEQAIPPPHKSLREHPAEVNLLNGQKLAAEDLAGDQTPCQTSAAQAHADEQQTCRKSETETLAGDQLSCQKPKAESLADNPDEDEEISGYQKGDYIPMVVASFAVWLLAILGILLILAFLFFLLRTILT